jgi:hypothetical protein
MVSPIEVRQKLKTLYFICVYLAVTQVEFRAILGSVASLQMINVFMHWK